MDEEDGGLYSDVLQASTYCVLGECWRCDHLWISLCPSQAPDQVMSVKKSSWFKIRNSCGLAGSSFGEPDFSAPDLALGCSDLAGYAGFLTPRSGWLCSSVLALGHGRGQELNDKEDKRIPSRKAGTSPQEPEPRVRTLRVTRSKLLKPPVPRFPPLQSGASDYRLSALFLASAV